jgi:hypothetical protein
MATVRITKELDKHIIQNAKVKFKDSIAKAEASRPDHHWGDYIYERIFGDYIPIMEQLPAGFFGTTTEIRVQTVGSAPCNLPFNLSTPRRWPNALPEDAPARRSYSGAALTLTDDLVWGELYAEVVAWKDRCDKARLRAQEFTEGVSKILSSFSTLAPALKEWPPLWELVPEYAKNKHKEITEKRKSDRSTIDSSTLNTLTAAMTASKLGGL